MNCNTTHYRANSSSVPGDPTWTTGFPTTGDTFAHFRKLARIKLQYEALRRGDTNVIWSSTHTGGEDDAGILAYERTGGDAGDQYALVVINTNGRKDSVTADGANVMKVTTRPGTLVDVLDPERHSYPVTAKGELRITVPKQRSMILVPEDDAKP